MSDMIEREHCYQRCSASPLLLVVSIAGAVAAKHNHHLSVRASSSGCVATVIS